MRFRYAMVCSSNQNQSMETHALLKRQGFDVASSYGNGNNLNCFFFQLQAKWYAADAQEELICDTFSTDMEIQLLVCLMLL